MPLKIFAGRASEELAGRICKYLSSNLGDVKVTTFADGEFEPGFGESIRGADVYIIQSTHPPAENIFELLLWIRAAREAAAKSITAVIPYFGYARQDRKPRPRVPITARLCADCIVIAGATNILTVDLHSAQIQGFFGISVDHLYARPVFLDYFKKNLGAENLIVIGPDVGAAKLAESYAQRLNNSPIAVAYKTRPQPNMSKVLCIVGDVRGKDVLIVDDIVDTAGTLLGVTDKLRDMGAGEIIAFCTHGVLSGDAAARIEQSQLSRLFITDTIPLRRRSPKIDVISIAPLLAEAIRRSCSNESVSSLFEQL